MKKATAERLAKGEDWQKVFGYVPEEEEEEEWIELPMWTLDGKPKAESH